MRGYGGRPSRALPFVFSKKIDPDTDIDCMGSSGQAGQGPGAPQRARAFGKAPPLFHLSARIVAGSRNFFPPEHIFFRSESRQGVPLR